ncbi:TIGR04282 family arsenosugar biosynthesis glycosyltransferase [Rhodoglobus sp.]
MTSRAANSRPLLTLVIIAKEPLAGHTKTRLNPPLSLAQAASLAAACIDDTIAATAKVRAGRRILYFQGANVPESAADLEVIAQSSGGLDERLASIFDQCTGPTLLIGMDTPQLTAALLEPASDAWPDNVDAWLGLAPDGGFWAIGMREPRGDLIRGIPMSTAQTGESQLGRLRDAGLRVGLLDPLNDVDTYSDAIAVAKSAPHTQFAQLLATMQASGL